MKILPISAVNPLLKEQPKYWDVITVGNALPFTRLCRRHCELDCDDELAASPGRPVWGGMPSRGPSSEQVRQALAFARESADERLIVHCHAGISRSPAIAWCILLARVRDIPLATQMLFEIRPDALPNPVIIRHGLEIITGSAAVHDSVMADMQRRSSHPQKARFLTPLA